MPELPEVETIVRSLRNPIELPFTDQGNLKTRPGILGRVIDLVIVRWARTVAIPGIKEFQSRLKGQSMRLITRRGKFIVIELTRDFLLVHLRMSGDIRVELNQPDTIQKHDRILLGFRDGSRLVFNDTRKFGRIWLVDDPEVVLGSLGPEPLSEQLTPEGFWELLQSRKKGIKTLLMDQTFLAGLGNIYTDESLHLARIHPLEISSSLDLESATCLLNAIRKTLNNGIERNGASIDWVYRGGDFQNLFRVYQRTGKPCLTCGTTIERMIIGQRGTHFCPSCQRIRPGGTLNKGD